MNRKFGMLFLAVLLFQAAVAYSENFKDALNLKYKKQVLALRTPFTPGDQKFDSDGHLLGAPAQGPWLIYGGIFIEKLNLSSDTLRLEGPRVAITDLKNKGKPLLIRLSKSVRINIHLEQPLKRLDEAEAVMNRVFFAERANAEHIKPEFRRSDDTSGTPIYHAGKDDVTYPKPIYVPEPDFSEEARKAKFQGEVVLNVVIDKAGNVERIRLENPAGRGLDQNAIDEVKQWRFEPATRNGQPVVVEMNVEVDFNLYSSHLH